MRYIALATDYDGTLAHDGKVKESTLHSLKRLRESGRKVIMVTGRELPDLIEVFPEIDSMDLVVAENGALLFEPKSKIETALAPAPPPEFVEELRRRGVQNISVGRSIVATWHPHENTVLEVIRDMGLELQVIFNKGAVMILPSGVNKASGLNHALQHLQLSPHNVVGVGDAENDHAFLALCECSAAVSNALDSLKERCTLTLQRDHGDGVVELMEMLLENDLAKASPSRQDDLIVIGEDSEGRPFGIDPYSPAVLIAGTSGGGKSTLATSFIENITAKNYQFCIVDPEGDYEELPHAVILGDSKRVPSLHEIMTVLAKPEQNCVVNLLGVQLKDRPAYFAKLMLELSQLRAQTCRPHWIIVDETHHLLPTERDVEAAQFPETPAGCLYITVEPGHIAPKILQKVDLILAIGEAPEKTIGKFSEMLKEAAPPMPSTHLQRGQSLIWSRRPPAPPVVINCYPPSSERKRHNRKYAEGKIKEEHSFYFRGPEQRLNLRAQNLLTFLQMGDGVDDDTWNYHLQRGDYATWFRDIIKDSDLEAAAQQLAEEGDLNAAESRARLREIIEKIYTKEE